MEKKVKAQVLKIEKKTLILKRKRVKLDKLLSKNQKMIKEK